jgi:hypothetical protein
MEASHVGSLRRLVILTWNGFEDETCQSIYSQLGASGSSENHVNFLQGQGHTSFNRLSYPI